MHENEIVSGDEFKIAESKSSTTAESNRTSSDKGKSSDERVFAVISTPRPSQPASDQVHHQTAGIAESKPREKVEPAVMRRTKEESSTAAGPAWTRGQEEGLPVETDRRQDQKVVVESSKPEPPLSKPVPTVSRTDPAHLHKLVNQRIEDILNSKQGVSTTATTHEVETQYSKTLQSMECTTTVESTTPSTTDDAAKNEVDGAPITGLRSEQMEVTSTEHLRLQESAEKTHTDVRQVRVWSVASI